MRTRRPYVRIDPDELERIRQIDLLTYLREFEPSNVEEVKGTTNVYRTVDHDSLKISNGKWFWWSQGIGGYSALDYLIKVRDYSFPEAVEILTGKELSNWTPPPPKAEKDEPKVLLLPPKYQDSSRVTQYLFGRGIDYQIIQECIADGMIFESSGRYHNAVFVGKDETGTLMADSLSNGHKSPRRDWSASCSPYCSLGTRWRESRTGCPTFLSKFIVIGGMAMYITVWNEYLHEKESEEIARVYPEGIHNCIGNFLRDAGMNVRTATLREPEHGLTQDVVDHTDVLLWWGHMAHEEVSDAVVERVYDRVMQGMGLIVLHSGHASKIFRKLCGTNTDELRWREDGKREILWVVEPSHPIAEGLPEKIILPQEEMYGERFNIPKPDDLVLISWFEGGEVFRSGSCYQRGRGKVFYFRPGHESFPVYRNPEIQQVILNAVRWAAPQRGPQTTCGWTPPVV